MTEIFTSEWFYNTKNIGTKIKSPIELIAGIMRILPMTFQKNDQIITYQRLLGQMLLYPPNVAGWPGGKSWIDSSTMMLRLQLPQIWSGIRALEIKPKEDDDLQMGMKDAAKTISNDNITINWESIESAFTGKDVSAYLLQTQNPLKKEAMKIFSGPMKQNTINLMAMPEYQMM